MTDKNLESMEMNMDQLDNVVGGVYVSSSMTISEIINTDRRLAGVLAKAGIAVSGNKGVMGQSLYEVA